MDTSDDDQPDTTIRQLPIDAEPLRQQIDRQQAAELAKRQVKEDEEICCQLLEELQRACSKDIFEEELVEHEDNNHDNM